MSVVMRWRWRCRCGRSTTCRAGQVMFSTSDIGWAVGHSYNVYGPLIAGCDLGAVRRPADPSRSGHLVAHLRAVRRAHDVLFADRHPRAQETGSGVVEEARPVELHWLFLAGEPLDEPTAHWITDGIGKTDHRQLLADRNRLAGAAADARAGHEAGASSDRPALPRPVTLQLIDEATGAEVAPNQKGVLVIVPPLPPGCLTTVWGDDQRFVQLFQPVQGSWCTARSTGRSATRTVTTSSSAAPTTSSTSPGHRLGTREIEEAVQAHPNVAEARWSV